MWRQCDGVYVLRAYYELVFTDNRDEDYFLFPAYRRSWTEPGFVLGVWDDDRVLACWNDSKGGLPHDWDDALEDALDEEYEGGFDGFLDMLDSRMQKMSGRWHKKGAVYTLLEHYVAIYPRYTLHPTVVPRRFGYVLLRDGKDRVAEWFIGSILTPWCDRRWLETEPKGEEILDRLECYLEEVVRQWV